MAQYAILIYAPRGEDAAQPVAAHPPQPAPPHPAQPAPPHPAAQPAPLHPAPQPMPAHPPQPAPLHLAPPPEPEHLAAHRRHSADLKRSGVLVAAFALQPVATATALRGEAITDGPFLETKEVIAGIYVVDVPDLDAALEVARRNPILRQGGGLEVRPVDASSA